MEIIYDAYRRLSTTDVVDDSESPKARDTYTNGIGMELVFLLTGKFRMGSPEDEADRSDDEVLHEVELTRGFWRSHPAGMDRVDG